MDSSETQKPENEAVKKPALSQVRVSLPVLVLSNAVVALLVWSYFDDTSRKLSREMRFLEANIVGLADQSRPPVVGATLTEAEGKMRPPKPEGWSTAEGDGYLIDLPPGYVLRAGQSGYDYVHSEPLRDDDLAPYAVIVKLSASQEAEYADKGGRLMLSGDTMYWMYLYENLEWKDFDQAAASLRPR